MTRRYTLCIVSGMAFNPQPGDHIQPTKPSARYSWHPIRVIAVAEGIVFGIDNEDVDNVTIVTPNPARLDRWQHFLATIPNITEDNHEIE